LFIFGSNPLHMDSKQINPSPSQFGGIADLANRNLLKNLPIAVYLCDMEGRITFYNQAAANLWGKEPELGKDLWCGSWKIYDADGAQILPEGCSMAVALRERKAVKGREFIIERPNGTRVNVLSHPQPILNEQGKMQGAMNMLTDITDKRKKEISLQASERKYNELLGLLEKKVEKRTQTLRKSEERYHKMVEEVQDYAILLLDKKGNIMNWNKGAENIKGYSEQEIIGKNFSIFYLQSDRDERLPQKLIKQAETTGKAMHEGWRLRKDRTMFWGYIVITALHDEKGNVIGFSKVTRDLTERKLAEDQLKENARIIEFRNKQLEEFAYIASHDLQEPLRKILTFADMLGSRIDDKESALNYVDKINVSAKRMSMLIKDVLKYSQISGEDDLAEIDLNTVIEDVKSDFELLIEERSATIVHSPLPKIKGVPIQMHQLFSNLVSNSIKFSEKPPVIHISSEYVEGETLGEDIAIPYPDRRHAKITFSDNGLGFEQEYASLIFKLFKRLDYSKSGTGIGLALCKKIADNHHGAITVSSTPGEGTAFQIYFPV
jgi:PAS domain S-box-containing protein